MSSDKLDKLGQAPGRMSGGGVMTRKKVDWTRHRLIKTWVGSNMYGLIYYSDIRHLFDRDFATPLSDIYLSAGKIQSVFTYVSALTNLLNNTQELQQNGHLYRIISVPADALPGLIKKKELVFNGPTSVTGADPGGEFILKFIWNRIKVVLFDIIADKSTRILRAEETFGYKTNYGFLSYDSEESEYILAPGSVITVDDVETLAVPEFYNDVIHVVHGRLTAQRLVDPASINQHTVFGKDYKIIKTLHYDPPQIPSSYDLVSKIRKLISSIEYDKQTIKSIREFLPKRLAQDYYIGALFTPIIRLDPLFQSDNWNKKMTWQKYVTRLESRGFNVIRSIIKKLWAGGSNMRLKADSVFFLLLGNPLTYDDAKQRDYLRMLKTEPDIIYIPAFCELELSTNLAVVGFEPQSTSAVRINVPANTRYVGDPDSLVCYIMSPLKCTKTAGGTYRCEITPRFPKALMDVIDVYF